MTRKIERGLRQMFGSEPFAGTITDRPTGITCRRRVAVPADARVQCSGELTRRVVRHQQPHVVPALLERRRLQLGVLDDGSPERPGERHHDPDLHAPGAYLRIRIRSRGSCATTEPLRAGRLGGALPLRRTPAWPNGHALRKEHA